jgi:hypothetical protein
MEPEKMAEDDQPWYAMFLNITLTQVAIVISFGLIIALMIATFNVVMSTGAIHFNDIDLDLD